MTSPLQAVPAPQRWWALLVLTAAVVAVDRLMVPSRRVLRAQTRDDGSSFGIVDFELRAGSTRTILDTWGEVGVRAARQQIGLDFVWLVLYAAALAVACIAVGEELGGTWRAVGVALSYAAVAAGLLDAVENTALLAVLADRATAVPARIAQVAALTKFALVVPALGFAVLGLAAVGLGAVRR